MRTIKGPALFLAQFASDVPPFGDWHGITAWAASLGYEGVQVPSGDSALVDPASTWARSGNDRRGLPSVRFCPGDS